jgi:hypothetical protein
MNTKQAQTLTLVTAIVIIVVTLIDVHPASLGNASLAHPLPGVAGGAVKKSKRILATGLFTAVTYLLATQIPEVIGYFVLLVLVVFLFNKTPVISKEFKSTFG